MAEQRERQAPPLHESEGQRINRELTEAAREAEERHPDETEPGGRYIVDGRTVNAEGEEAK